MYRTTGKDFVNQRLAAGNILAMVYYYVPCSQKMSDTHSKRKNDFKGKQKWETKNHENNFSFWTVVCSILTEFKTEPMNGKIKFVNKLSASKMFIQFVMRKLIHYKHFGLSANRSNSFTSIDRISFICMFSISILNSSRWLISISIPKKSTCISTRSTQEVFNLQNYLGFQAKKRESKKLIPDTRCIAPNKQIQSLLIDGIPNDL